MFASGTADLVESLTHLPGMPPERMRRVLSEAYSFVLATELDAELVAEDDLSEVYQDLDALVGVFETHVVLNPELPSTIQESSAFVAAEAAYLLAGLSPAPDAGRLTSWSWIWMPEVHQAVRAGLLYMISHHYSNAEQTAKRFLRETPQRVAGMDGRIANRLFESLRSFLTFDLSSRASDGTAPMEAGDLPTEQRVRAAVSESLMAALDKQVEWLSYRSSDDAGSELRELKEAEERLAEAGRYPELVGLLRLTRLAMSQVAGRALRAQGWDENDANHVNYLSSRCAYRPVVWPAGYEYARLCFPGPSASAVVAVPTGSGKGFLAETAVAQAAGNGWVIYLVPTNALANQVRQELASVFSFSQQIDVQAFLGGQEFTLLETESVETVASGTVVVMTPEKCAAALRRSPTAFQTLQLLVFDECHLIGETGSRGSLAELVVSHIVSLAPDSAVLFTSALVQNPSDLSEWLDSISDLSAHAISSAWRPTRTMRGVVGVARTELRSAADEARDKLSALPRRRKNVRFRSPLRAVLSLQGAWGSSEDNDYAILDPPVDSELVVSRSGTPDSWSYAIEAPGWVNRTSAIVIQFLVERGNQVLGFLPASRHHPFVVAGSVRLADDSYQRPNEDSAVEAHLVCAEYELGVESEVRQLIGRGIAVHSSAILDSERHASELAFRSGMTPLRLATGTLAQGLNLPATAVVVGGTRIGGGQEPGLDAERRSRAQLLNAVGRAGRAEYANHGLALVVPSGPFAIGGRSSGRRDGGEAAPFLRFEDGSVPVRSSLLPFMQRVRAGDLMVEALTVEEMTAFTYAPAGGRGDEASAVFSRTMAVWSMEEVVQEEIGRSAAEAVDRLGQAFFARAEIPDWVRDVAAQVGIPLPALFSLYRAAAAREADRDDLGTIDGWLRRLIQLLASIGQPSVATLLFGTELLGGQVKTQRGWTFAELSQPDVQPTREAWRGLYRTLAAYLSGAPYSEIAVIGLELSDSTEIDTGRSAGSKPIPKAIGALKDLGERLSILAGGLVALHHFGAEESEHSEFWELDVQQQRVLSLLPLAVRAGCGDISSLSWYRFGIRYRRPSHLLSRAFPVPGEILEDDEIRSWVRATRAEVFGPLNPQWGTEFDDVEFGVLDALNEILSQD